LLDIIAKNVSQVSNKIIRGGIYTNVGSGGVTEAAISTGGILGYNVPTNKKATFKGTLTPIIFNSNSRLALNIFDNVAGRIIQVSSVSSFPVGTNEGISIQFAGVLESSDFDFIINGNSAANDGSLNCIMDIVELPR